MPRLGSECCSWAYQIARLRWETFSHEIRLILSMGHIYHLTARVAWTVWQRGGG
jgi:hypothetical protein